MSLADPPWSPSSVQVTVLQARGLRIKGKSGTNDAYAVMQVGKEKYQTSVAEKSVAPVWKEEAAFDVVRGGTLHVHVLHRALVGPDKLLGQAVVELLRLGDDRTRSKTEWFKLLGKNGKPDKDRGEVLLEIHFMRNNMTASMFDLSAAGKPRSRLGKFKDKVRGKKKERDGGSTVVQTFSQVLTDSEEDGNGDGEEKKKTHKIKSLFSPKSNLQRNMSQSMSVLPVKNSPLSSSQASGLNVDSSEGKKKFKFMMHKRSGSSDSKDSTAASQKQTSVEQSSLCINGSHIYCEEPQPRSARVGSNFSLASSGHGSMEDVPDSSPPSVDSLGAVRTYSPWTEEDEEDEEDDGATRQKMVVGEELQKVAEGRRVEEKQRTKQEEEEEERLRREEGERARLAEEKKKLEEEERRRGEEEQRIRMEEKRAQEEEKERLEEEERIKEKARREEEERVRKEEYDREEKRRLEEQERKQREEEERIREEEERKRMEEKKKQEEDERKVTEEAERVRRQEEERRMLEERERKAQEEVEKRIQEEEERARKEKEEYVRLVEEKKRREEEERIRMEEERAEKERREKEEYERLVEEKIRQEEEERVREEEERKRMEEKKKQEEDERKAQEEVEKRIQEEEEERARKEKEEYVRLVEEKKKRREEERIWMERAEKERREKEEYERLVEEKRRQEEEERARKEKEEYVRLVEEKKRKEEEERKRRESQKKREEEERVKREKEEMERLVEEKRRQEEDQRRKEEERMQREESQKKREEEERVKKEREERDRLMEEERKRKEDEEENLREEKRRLEEQEKRRNDEEEEKMEREDRVRAEEKDEVLCALEKETSQEEKKTHGTAAGHKAADATSETLLPAGSQRPAHVPPADHEPSVSGPHRCQLGEASVGKKTDEKESVSVGHWEKRRPAPLPPGANPVVRNSPGEQDADKRPKTKDANTVSVPPQRSSHASAAVSLPPTNAASKHTKRPAPTPPRSAVEEASPADRNTLSHGRDGQKVFSLNPFEDDEDENDPAASGSEPRPVVWPPAPTRTPDKDDVSQARLKSSKVARAPPPPTQTSGTQSALSKDRGAGGAAPARDPQPEAQRAASVQESRPQESQPGVLHRSGEEAAGKKEGTALRRLQPVKPLSPLEQESLRADKEKREPPAGILCEVQENKKVNDKGPYSLLTREELVALVMKQENQLVDKDKKIAELEQYIDNLLVRVIEEQPSILMSISSWMKAV